MITSSTFKRIAQPLLANLKSKEALASLLFLLGLIAFETIFFNLRIRHYFESIQRHEYLIGVGGLLIVCASWFWVGLFVLASLLSNYAMRLVYFLLLSFAAAFEYGYQKAFGTFSTVAQLRTALFEAAWQQRLDAIFAYANWLAIVPCVAYAVLLLTFRRRRERSWLTGAVLLLALIGFYSAIGPYISGHFTTVSLTAFMRTVITSPWKWAGGYQGPRDNVVLHPDHRPQNNIIFVIDESVRGDHLSINGYARATTPYLKELANHGWLYNWGVAVAGTTCSFDSDSLLLTGLTPAQLPDTNFKIRKIPTIFQYAKAMGYQTHFFDTQKDLTWLGTPADANFIDDWQRASNFPAANSYERDLSLARKITDVTKDSAGHFIFVIKYGIHFPYSRAMPKTAIEWQPADLSDRIDPSRSAELTNSYDSALKFNLEGFFKELEIENWQVRNLLVYTSDHGQTLSEHGERHTHCGTTQTSSITEAMVPLFIISREPLPVDLGYRASHANIFSTLLDFMQFPANERRDFYARSLLNTKAIDSQPRQFWVGDPSERILGARIRFDK